MFHTVMSNSTSLSLEEASVSNPLLSTISTPQTPKIKKKRSLPGNPDPDAEVIALSPKSLLATNRFVCEICKKGFQRDQNLQLHRRGHNLPWKLKQRNSKEIRKRAYVCPEPTCVHHHPSRALGDLTGIKKHFCRKHGEKKWKCDKCSKIYAVQSDWKAHSKTCGTREYRCDCGTLFSRKDSFITHRAFCEALAEESARVLATTNQTNAPQPFFPFTTQHFPNPPIHISLNPWEPPPNPNPNPNSNHNPLHITPQTTTPPPPPPPPHRALFRSFIGNTSCTQPPLVPHSAHLSATALLQKAATMGAHSVGHVPSTMVAHLGTVGHVRTPISPDEYFCFSPGDVATWHKTDRLTRDFLGLTADCGGGGGGGNGGGNATCGGSGGGNVDGVVQASVNRRGPPSFAGCVELATYERDYTLLKTQGFGFADTWG